MAGVVYPSVDQVIVYNELCLSRIVVKKADRHEVLSRSAITETIARAAATLGTVYDKAATLLTGLCQVHAFASGNRRTALLVTKDFLQANGATFAVNDDPANARIIQGISEGRYTPKDVREWLRNG
jgi:prophage maintenance system killer protein